MIKSIKVINYLGESLTISMKNPEKSGFFIKSIDGLGPTKSTINTMEVLSVDGAFFNSARTTSRNLVFNIGFLWSYGLSIESLRQLTYRFFPNKQIVQLEIETDNRIGCTYGYVESNEPNIFSIEESTSISIICPDAYFYEKNNKTTKFTGTIPMFQFPFQNPSITDPLIEFSQMYIHTTETIFYDGDSETGVVINIDILGNVRGLSIYNDTTGQRMDIVSAQVLSLTGADLKSGDKIVISTSKGYKTISLLRSGVSYNIMNAIGQNADWFVMTRGNNVFRYSATSNQDKLLFEVLNNILYEGL